MQLISAADLLDSISFMVIRPTTRRWPSFNISVSIEPPPLSKGRKYLSYGSFLGGIVLGSVHTYTEAQIGAGLITIGGLIGIIYDLTTDHETIAFKEYKKIKDIQDKNQKEKLSYEALVFLAKKSTELKKANTHSSGNLIGNIAGIIITNKLNEVLLTPEEKLLNNYLDQKSIK